MKLVHILPSIFLLSKNTSAVQCYSCTDAAFNADETADASETCWHPDSTTPTITCTDGTQTCGEQMSFLDGWPVSVTRGCNTLLTGALEDTPGETRNTITCSNNLNQFRNLFDSNYPGLDEEFATTTCQSDCTTDNCNLRVELTQLQICDPTKNTPNDGLTKWCDFITGTWMCRSAFGGGVATDNVACVAPVVVTVAPVDNFTPISCIQCNSETDGNSCWTKTAVTACESEIYVSCSSETSITYNKETGEKIRESITRGCSTDLASIASILTGTGSPVFDQCHWSSNEEMSQTVFGAEKEIASGKWFDEHQLNCVTRCDPSESGAGCNIVPDGDVRDIARRTCASFDLTGDAAALSSAYMTVGFELCEFGATECYSEVTYLVRGMQDYAFDPVTDAQDRVRILSHKRGCKTAAMEIEDACVEDETFTASANVDGIDLKKVTCTEVCNGSDDCNNNNWPMRPKCLQDGNSFANAFGTDYVQPCSSPAHSACTVQEYNMIHEGSNYKKFVDDHVVASGLEYDMTQNLGFSTSIRRGCVVEESDVPTGCTTNGKREGGRFGYKNSLFFENCNFTCTDDGCNFGTGYSSGFSVIASTAAIVIAFVMN